MPRIEYALVGTSVYEDNYREVHSLRDAVKRRIPDALFAIGGPFVTKAPRTVLRLTGADLAFRGEADYTFREAVRRISQPKPLEDLLDIPGLLAQRDGKIMVGTGASHIPVLTRQELSGIHIDYDLLAAMQERLHYPSVDAIFSRACPIGTCSYCQTSGSEGSYRCLSDGQILEMVAQLRKLPKANTLLIDDAVFGGSAMGAKRLLRKLANLPNGFEEYRGMFTVEQLLLRGEPGMRQPDPELMALIKELRMDAEIGVENLSSGGLKKLKTDHHYTPVEAMDLMRHFASAKMPAAMYTIEIAPETRAAELAEHYTNTCRLLDDVLSSGVISYLPHAMLRPYMGTPDYLRIASRLESDPEYRRLSVPLFKQSLIRTLDEPEEPKYLINHFLPFDPIVSRTYADSYNYENSPRVSAGKNNVGEKMSQRIIDLYRRIFFLDHNVTLMNPPDAASIDEALCRTLDLRDARLKEAAIYGMLEGKTYTRPENYPNMPPVPKLIDLDTP